MPNMSTYQLDKLKDLICTSVNVNCLSYSLKYKFLEVSSKEISMYNENFVNNNLLFSF